jgi:hypothetical protein
VNSNVYRKLPGRGMAWTGLSRVWQGDDHVLLVANHIFAETYRRFFYADIQGIVVRRTHLGKSWNAIWICGLIFFAALAAVVDDAVGSLVLLGFAAPFAVGLIANLLLGPTCACHIRTAVQSERVPALSRMRAARRFLDRVEPLIVAAQGEWPTQPVPAGPEPNTPASATPATAPPA